MTSKVDGSSTRPDSDLDDYRASQNMSRASTSSAPAFVRPWLFLAMTRCPYPFLVTMPFLFFLLIFLGLSRPSLIEEDVSNLWIPTEGSYKKDKEYAKSVGANTQDELSTFAAMALSRHGDNLLTEDNLNTIVERMKLIETTLVTYKGINFTWNDICLANGLSRETTYQMPCLRLSPMDLFQEARWYFTEEQRVTWYTQVKGVVMKPLVIRYGVLQEKCTTPADNTACDHAAKLRADPDYAMEHGYPYDYAGTATDLLQDIFAMELNDPCRICVEANIDEQLRQIKDNYVIPAFTTLTQQLRRFLFAVEEVEDVSIETLKYVESLIKKTATIATKVSREDVEDFYMYYIIRDLYSQGAEEFQALYRDINDPLYRGFICGNDDLICPPADLTLEEARELLLRHADNMFSSHVSFGAPFPFWSSPDGKGHLFAGNHPVSGSGINMSAPFDSLALYLDLENRNEGNNWEPLFHGNRRRDGFVDPLGNDPLWETMVSTNPVYAWFMAGETEMTANCGNGDLLGTNTSDVTIDMLSAELVRHYSQHLCTKYHIPFEKNGTHTQQHFARIWFDMLIDSPFVLGITQGEDDPYTWTSGTGCGYDLGYSRFSYTEQPEDVILQNASGELYNIDEGAEVGVIDRTPLIGDAYPPVGEYSFDNPLEHVGLLQTVYATLAAADITKRVQHKNRPGGPLLNITEDDAREVLGLFKQSFESLWTQGWDDDEDGNISFVGFFDDAEVPGTIATFLNSVTMSSGLMTAISIIVIAIFSVAFLARRNPIESKVGITLVGVILVILAFFAAVGLGILAGIKVNLTIAWTLPFIMIGLGVDNVYIILMSLQKQGDYSDKGFFKGMIDVVIPITMTSLVNFCMFAVMNVNDIPAVYLTARVACIAVLFLYLGVMLSFPAYCYLDMQRQYARRRDVFVWKTYETAEDSQNSEKSFLERLLYDSFYQPLIFGQPYIRVITHSLIWACAALLLALGLYGISINTVGVGLEDFLPPSHQGHVWATARTEILGSWVVGMNWPDLDYGSPDTQMKMIQQFENVASTPHIVEIDTRMLWIAEMALWTTRQCDYNTALDPTEDRICGRDHVFDEESTCSGTWKRNIFGLREKYFTDNSDEQCQPYDGGVCRPTSEMHPDDLRDVGIDPENISGGEASESWCPVFEGWSEEKMAFCIRKWQEHVDGSGGLVLDTDAECEGEFCEDYMVKFPIPYSAGPPMTAKGVVSHELTLLMMAQTRAACDQDKELHCWMSGPPFDFWSQYDGIQMNLVEISGAAVLIGFGISLFFFAFRLFYDGQHPLWKVLCGSLVGAVVIAGNCFFCLVAVVGISILSGVSLTAFSIMSFVLSVGFAVEYSVHIVSRWLRSDRDSALDRVEHTMSFLMLPTFMSFVSSSVGVICLAFTDFEFNTRFFFRPLIIVMFVTYFFGTYWLPVFLTWFEFDFVKLGPMPRRLGHSRSLLSKMQESESSQVEAAASSGSDLLLNNENSDIETNSCSLQPNLADCTKTALGESESRSFEFLPCYNMVDCGGASDSKSFDDDSRQPLSVLPRPLAASYNSGLEGKAQSEARPTTADELEENSILQSTLPPRKPDSAAAHFPISDDESTDKQPPSVRVHRSGLSAHSSQDTFAISNKQASRLGKTATMQRSGPHADFSQGAFGTSSAPSALLSKSAPPTSSQRTLATSNTRARATSLGKGCFPSNNTRTVGKTVVEDAARRIRQETGSNQQPFAPAQEMEAREEVSTQDSETSEHTPQESESNEEPTTESAGIASVRTAGVAIASQSGDTFDGIDVVPATEAQNPAPMPSGPLNQSSLAPTSALPTSCIGIAIDAEPATGLQNVEPEPLNHSSMAPMCVFRPESIATSAQTTSQVPQGPVSTGGIFRSDNEFFEDADDLPSLRQSQSSSPRKRRIWNPLRFKGRGSSSRQANVQYGEEGLLHPTEQDSSDFGGYDFGHVLEGSAIHGAVGPNDDAPKSNREILRTGSGEVVPVHAAFDADTASKDTDTVNF